MTSKHQAKANKQRRRETFIHVFCRFTYAATHNCARSLQAPKVFEEDFHAGQFQPQRASSLMLWQVDLRSSFQSRAAKSNYSMYVNRCFHCGQETACRQAEMPCNVCRSICKICKAFIIFMVWFWESFGLSPLMSWFTLCDAWDLPGTFSCFSYLALIQKCISPPQSYRYRQRPSSQPAGPVLSWEPWVPGETGNGPKVWAPNKHPW